MRRDYAIQDGKVVEALPEQGNIVVYITPDEGERRFLIDQLRVDEHTLACALDPDETPRLEFEPDHAALIMNRPRNYSREDQFMFRVASAGVFLFQDRLIVVLAEDAPVFDGGKHLSRVVTVQDVVLKILYRSIVHFLGHLKSINAIADELEQKINTSMENKHLLNLFTLEKSLVYLATAIHANGTLIEKMRHNAAKLGFTAEALEILDDIHIENSECNKQAEIYSSVIAGLMDARASLVSNNLNIMMKNLNALVIAVAVPSFFAGMGGMSEFSMMTGAERWTIAYPVFLAAMLAIGVGTFYLIRFLERYWW
jgi:magnesium transporter